MNRGGRTDILYDYAGDDTIHILRPGRGRAFDSINACYCGRETWWTGTVWWTDLWGPPDNPISGALGDATMCPRCVAAWSGEGDLAYDELLIRQARSIVLEELGEVVE